MRGDEFFVEVAKRPPFTKLQPRVAAFFKEYFAHEKVIRFGDQHVVNTHFPPYPSRAFDNLAEGFALIGGTEQRRLYSVTLAVTNRCPYECWHCYNAARDQTDLPLETLQSLAGSLQEHGAVMVTLTGGEPLLRRDLPEIARVFDDRCCLLVGTTGAGLTQDRARRLRDSGVFALALSLDSADAAEHDRLRGKSGAFATALRGLQLAEENGLYPYIVSVATREFLRPERFWPFVRFAGKSGAREVHLLEPSATGKLAGRSDVLLSQTERAEILQYQREVAGDDELPILSSYTYLEGEDAFGCGAGSTHLYIDGTGEVCPCQLVPLSFGNATRESLNGVLDRMGRYFRQPRARCAGRLLAPHIPAGRLPVEPSVSEELCGRCLPSTHPLPRFFQIRGEAQAAVGKDELQDVYDRVHGDYDAFWLCEAAGPIKELVQRLLPRQWVRVFEAGCGTGYSTALLAQTAGSVLAVDISAGMLAIAQKRLSSRGCGNVRFLKADALQILQAEGPFDLVFSSWVLGYIPLAPFFSAASSALAPSGCLAFVVHKENSPREPLEIFAELVARDPLVLGKKVAFDFPRDTRHVEQELAAAKLQVTHTWEGVVTFRYGSPREVLDHLLKSGAGTAFHDAIDPNRREALTEEFLTILRDRHPDGNYEVCHDYVACIAQKPS